MSWPSSRTSISTQHILLELLKLMNLERTCDSPYCTVQQRNQDPKIQIQDGRGGSLGA